MSAYSDGWWRSNDGLRLHYREYGEAGQRPPILCLPGLTRNARDFENLAQSLAGEWRVLCPEMRGRALSEYAQDGASYTPLQYVADIAALLEQVEIARFVAVGTSLGGLMTMLLALVDNTRIAAALLNDIGPVLDPAGLQRIASYVGKLAIFGDWAEAADALQRTQAVAYPDYRDADWLAMAKRVMARNRDGRIIFDYDPKIAEGFGQPTGPVDLWPGIDALAGRPVLLVRGGLSDLLSADTFAAMRQRLSDADAVTLPRIGHAPTLDEPEARAAITRWLAQVA
ncbi:MAG: alpha/beta hydrolase [Pseudomonadota bacterium]|nr:alpha/beta hydrolase [Pseudomonadota bacterium]